MASAMPSPTATMRKASSVMSAQLREFGPGMPGRSKNIVAKVDVYVNFSAAPHNR